MISFTHELILQLTLVTSTQERLQLIGPSFITDVFLLGAPEQILMTPPDNTYHGPILNPIASEFMSDLSKGSVSTEEAMDLMNNYVSGSQDTSESIKKLQGVLGKVHAREVTPGAGGLGPGNDLNTGNGIIPVNPVNNLSPMNNLNSMSSLNPANAPSPINAFNSVNNLNPSLPSNNVNPMFANKMTPQLEPNAPMMGNGMGTPPGMHPGGEIAALMAVGPNRNYMENNNNLDPNAEEEERERENPGETYSRHSYPEPQRNNGGNFDQNVIHQEQEAPFINQQQNPGGPPNAAGSDIQRVNQLMAQKPPPVHLFQEFNSHELHSPHGENMVADEQQRNTPAIERYNNPVNQPMDQNFDNGDGQSQNMGAPFPGSRQEMDQVRNMVGNFLNRIDPHEISPNPSVALPETGLTRHTLSRRPAPSFRRKAMSSGIPSDISYEYAHAQSDSHPVFKNMPVENHLPQSEFNAAQQQSPNPEYQRVQPVAFHNSAPQHRNGLGNPEHRGSQDQSNSISAMYTDSIFPEDYADIESLQGSLQGKTLSVYDRRQEANAQGRSETHPNKGRQIRVSFPLQGDAKSARRTKGW